MFRVIRPQKVLFLAVDGVAPRAKMNQQRGRRFRSARESQDLIHKAQQKGKLLPLELCFDSNCSTPGTDFMSRLHEQLMYFINQKLNSDPPWQRVKAILSGHDVQEAVIRPIPHIKGPASPGAHVPHMVYVAKKKVCVFQQASQGDNFCLKILPRTDLPKNQNA
ncbi:hypothetical protein EMCRGX_G016274 [Ephydatia muelleri]